MALFSLLYEPTSYFILFLHIPHTHSPAQIVFVT